MAPKKKPRKPAPDYKSQGAFMGLDELESVEILRAGALPSRNIEFTVADLREIAQNTNELIADGLHNPPGKLGHDDDQAFARMSGLPATGWVERLSVVGDRLMAKFRDVPAMLKEAFKKRLFSKVSSEVYFDFAHPETHKPMGKLLRAVAFLGADIPEVKGLRAFLDENAPKLYAFSDGDHEATELTDLTITIDVKDNGKPEPPAPVEPPSDPATPVAPAPGDLTAEGLAGRDLELFRQAEKVVEAMAGDAISEFEQDKTVNGLLRFVARVGVELCSSDARLRALSDNPEELCAWLEARAKERGLIQSAPREEIKMADVKELEAKLAESNEATKAAQEAAKEASDKAEKLALELAEERKAQGEAKIAAFIEGNKEVITPAVEPYFRALCEAVKDGEHTVKLSEDKSEAHKGPEIALAVVKAVAASKQARFDELVKESKAKEGVSSKNEVKGATLNVELHEKALELQEADKSLSYWDAIKKAHKEGAASA